jgi:hypothetical protein
MDRVPDSATAFIDGMAIMLVGVIVYYFGGPPGRNQFLIVKALSTAAGVASVNYFIFTFKDRYKKIIEYYEIKYVSRPPWFTYFIIPTCYIFLMYLFKIVHDHYADCYSS